MIEDGRLKKKERKREKRKIKREGRGKGNEYRIRNEKNLLSQVQSGQRNDNNSKKQNKKPIS